MATLSTDKQMGCTDTPPSGGHTCAQQKACGKSFMKGHCCKTCHNCSCGARPSPPGPPRPPLGPKCADKPPSGSWSCAQQKAWGKCHDSFMKGHCCQTCFNCKNCGGGELATI